MVNLSNILTNGVIFSTLKLTDPRTVRGRPILKDGLCNKRIVRNGLFRELKIGKESNDLAKVSLEFIKAGIFKTGNLWKRESLKRGISKGGNLQNGMGNLWKRESLKRNNFFGRWQCHSIIISLISLKDKSVISPVSNHDWILWSTSFSGIIFRVQNKSRLPF